MARKVGQIVRRGECTWLVRVYNGRDRESKKRKYLNQTVHGRLRDAQSHLNKMFGERDRGRNLDSSKQTLNQFLDRWLEVCAKPRLRTKDYEGLLRRHVRPRVGEKALSTVSGFDVQMLYRVACCQVIRPLNPLYPRSSAVGAQTGRPLKPHSGKPGGSSGPTKARRTAGWGTLG